jgi:uncharacterized protein (DUF697 family)
MATETAQSSSAKTETDEQAKPGGAHEASAAGNTPGVKLSPRAEKARTIVQRNVLWSLGAGVVPVPLLDVVAVSGVQIKMLKEISDLYEVPFTEGMAKKIVSALLSSLGGVTVGTLVGASLAKAIPLLGTALGVISTPVLAGAFTYATGHVFLLHFESGGTIVNFDTDAVRAHFKQEFERAKGIVAKMQDDFKRAKKP